MYMTCNARKSMQEFADKCFKKLSRNKFLIRQSYWFCFTIYSVLFTFVLYTHVVFFSVWIVNYLLVIVRSVHNQVMIVFWLFRYQVVTRIYLLNSLLSSLSFLLYCEIKCAGSIDFAVTMWILWWWAPDVGVRMQHSVIWSLETLCHLETVSRHYCSFTFLFLV